MQTLTGTASHVTRGTGTDVIHNNRQAVGVNTNLLTFRIDGRPVHFKSRDVVPSLEDGDRVAAAGGSKAGTLHAEAVRNLNTGATYAPPTVLPLVLGLVLAVMSVPLMIVLVGFLFLPIALYVLYRVWVVRSAISSVNAVNADAVPADAPKAIAA